MVRVELLRKRLEKLEEYLAILRQLQGTSEGKFIRDPQKYGAAERFLQLAIETTLDMGNHVIAGLRWGKVDVYRDIPERFYEQGYIDETLRETWIKMIGFRNLLIHDYLTVDRRLVYEVLQHRLADLESLKTVFARFL